MAYDDVSDHLMMLRDSIRTEAYLKAINQCVKPGDRVMDFGCGSGILACFAARAGAGRVYAIDRSPFIKVARQLAADNGFDRIEFLEQDAGDVSIEDQVDVLVSEWMGHFLFWEWMLDPLIELRNRYLKPGGIMLPATAQLHCGLVTDPAVFQPLTLFRKPVYGLDYSFLADWPMHRPALMRFTPDQIHPRTTSLCALDLATCPETPGRVTGSITTDKTLTAYGLGGWFSSQLCPGEYLDTSPFSPETHWRHVFFPFETALKLTPDSPVEVDIWLQKPGPAAMTVWRWRAKQGGQVQDLNNLAHKSWLGKGD